MSGGPERRRPRGAVLIVAVLVVLLAGLWLLSRGERELQRSAVGFAGLVEWLL